MRDKNLPQKNTKSTLQKKEEIEVNESTRYPLTETVLAGSPADRPWEGCVNGENYRVPRGVKVIVPTFLKEHIENTEREKAEAEERAESLSKLAGRITDQRTTGSAY